MLEIDRYLFFFLGGGGSNLVKYVGLFWPPVNKARYREKKSDLSLAQMV